jgi:hypothetical protein
MVQIFQNWLSLFERNCPDSFPAALFLADFPGRVKRFPIQESDGR